jgi:hypothetical protein
MSDANHVGNEPVVEDFIDDPVHADTQPVGVVLTC